MTHYTPTTTTITRRATMMTTSNNDHDYGKNRTTSIHSSPRKALACKQQYKSESNFYGNVGSGSIMSMESLPSSLERSCSIIDLSLSMAFDEDDSDTTDSETQNENRNENETVKETTQTLPPTRSGPITPSSTSSSMLLPLSSTRLPLLPRRGLFQQRHSQRYCHNHERARILKSYDPSILAFPILPSSSSSPSSADHHAVLPSPVMLPSPTSSVNDVITNSNGNIFSLKMKPSSRKVEQGEGRTLPSLLPVPSCIGLLPRRKTRQRQLDDGYQQTHHLIQDQEQECSHTKKKGRRFVDTTIGTHLGEKAS